MTSIRPIIALFVAGLVALFAHSALSQTSGPNLVGATAEAPQDVRRPTPEIGEIHFRGGYLEQNAAQPGHWFEKKNNGTINYEFFETGSTPQSLIMSGPEGKVTLSIDLGANEVQGKWPGQNSFKTIYKITKVNPMKVAPAAPAPRPQRPTSQSGLAPRDLHMASYKSGRFLRVSANDWEQSTDLGEVFSLRQVGYDEQGLYLRDPMRSLLIMLDPATLKAQVAIDGGVFQPYEMLLEVSDAPQTPIPAQPDGTLSEAERNTCLKTGGIVERAGLLGAQRCTRPYSDGGQVCSDSSQCQGRCRTTPNVPAGSPVTGICQPSDNPFGCFAEVSNGIAGPGLCVD